MRISKYKVLILFCTLLFCSVAQAQIGMRELGDSLMVWTGFSRVWSPSVRVKQMRINGNQVTLKTNLTLRDVRWTPENVAEIKRKVSLWTLGYEKGNVTIYSGQTDIESLITECAKGGSRETKSKDLTERTIVLYPSHGLYFNRDRDEWIWQRATLWTTVEDLYSQEYVRNITKMLENAGATVLSPRAGLDQQALGASGMPQWTEGARYWMKSQGADSTLWDLYEGNEYKDDMKCRAMWVNSLEAPVDLCIAFHTDGQDSGNDSTIIGTLVIYTAKDDEGQTTLRNGRDRERVNRNLADYIQTQVTEDLRVIAPEWTRRQLKEANYCETRVPVVPSIILELLSHKNMADMRYGLDPQFRFTAARAVYKGILRYLNGREATVQPLPVQQLAIDQSGLLRWEARTDSLEPSAKASYYMVYVQANDGEWDIQQVEGSTQLQLELTRGVQYNYYVVAGNEGGLSLPSPMISAYLSEQEDAPTALIIDGFDDTYGVEWFADSTFAGIVPGSYACEDGFSCAYIGQQWDYRRANEWKNDDNCGWGACYRDHAGQITVGNTHNWSVQHGQALHKMQISYVSATEQMAQIDSTYAIVDVVCGRQREPLRDKTREQISAYVRHGGRVLMSSDHVSKIDPKWLSNTMHASYYAAQATRNGRIAASWRRIYHLVLEPNEVQIFTCCPEGLQAEKNAIRMATYEDMRCPAAVGYEHRTLLYGFPLEAIQEFDKIYRHSIEWLLER